MEWRRRVLGGFAALFRRGRVEDELDEELRAYLQIAIDERMRAGMSEGDAIRAARVQMGALEAIKDHTRDVGWEAGLESVWQDVRCAVRTLRKSPGFFAVAVLTLALGIGANAAIFSIVNGLLLRSLPVAEPQRLVTISSDMAVSLGFTAGAGWNYPMWERLRERAGAFGGALAFMGARFNLAQSGERQPVDGLYVSGEFFTTLGLSTLFGRTFTPADDERGGGPDGPVAVISHRLWQERFGGAAGVIGTPITIEGVPFTIVGVTPPEFLHLEVGRTFDVAVPLGTQTLIRGSSAAIDQPRALVLIIMLRLSPEQSLESATATLRAMQPDILGVTPERLASVQPAFLRDPFTLVPASAGTSGAAGSGLRQRYQRPIVAVLIITGLVLLVACANLANLLLARATARRHELSVRRALGASRWRLARQWLVESCLLAGLGAAVGLAVAAWSSRMLVAQLSTTESRVALDLSLDWAVLAYTAAVALVTVTFFGTVPSLRATRVAPIEALKTHGANAGDRLSGGVSSRLVVVQVACSLVLLAAAGLLVRTFDQLARVPLGFDPDRVLIVDVDITRARVDPTARLAYFDRLVDVVAGAPGVAHAAASMWTPLSGGGANLIQDASGRTVDSDLVVTNFVTPAWFDVYGIGIRAGRDFDERDAANALPVAIVNETFVRRFLPGRQATGEAVEAMGGWRTIVGIAADAAFARSLRDGVPPMMYVPLAQSAGPGPLGATSIRVSIRSSSGTPASSTRGVMTALTGIDQDLAFSFRPLADYIDEALAQDRLVAMLSAFFGGLALLLAAIGLYGVAAYTATRRRREIAIRLALGAQRSAVVGLVVRRGLGLTAAGVVLGLVAAAAVTRYLEALLFGVTPLDLLTFVGVSLLFAAVAAVASYMPARRASQADPMIALRAE